MATLFTIDGHNYIVQAQGYAGEPPRWEVRDDDGIILSEAHVTPCSEYVIVENLNGDLLAQFYLDDDMTNGGLEQELAYITAYDGV